MTKLKFILIFMLLFLLNGNVINAEDANNGTIEGLLINGSSGATVPDQTVMMLIVGSGSSVDTRTTTSDAQGKFAFTGLSTDPQYNYGIGVRYETVEYYTGPVNFSSGETTKSVELKVYDTTEEAKNISIMMSHAIISNSDGKLAVKEYHLLMNSGNTTFIGKNPDQQNGVRQTLKFYLPEGATNFESSYGLMDYNIVDKIEVIDSTPIVPGQNEIGYTYSVPSSSQGYTMRLKLNYTIARFDLLIADNSIKVESSQLTESTPLNISAATYRDFVGQNFNAGDIIEVKLSSSGTSLKAASLLKWAWLIFIPVALAVFFILKRKKPVAVVTSEKDSLMAEIADLDDRFERKEIEKDEYLKLRQQQKSKLLDIIKNEKG